MSEFHSGVGSMTKAPSENDGVTSNLDLFAKSDRDISLKEGRQSFVRPISENELGPYSFLIPAESGLFPDTSSFRLSGEISMQKENEDGEWINIDNTDKVSVCNLVPASLFKTLEVSLNGVVVSFVASPNYAYKAYLETICSYGTDAARTHLATSRYLNDIAGKYDDVTFKTAQTEQETSWDKRRKWFLDGAKCDFSTPLHIDVFNTPRLFPDHVNIELKLARNNDSFSIMQAQNNTSKYKLKITNLLLEYIKIKVDHRVQKSLESSIKSGQLMNYPITRTLIRTRALDAGANMVKISPLFLGAKLPNQIILGMVKTAALTGSIHHNPFNFQHFNVESVQLELNSQLIPSQPLKINANSKTFMRQFRYLYDNLGIGHGNEGCLIEPSEFLGGKCIYSWDLNPDKCAGAHLHQEQSGTIGFLFNFTEPLPMGVSLICHASWSDQLSFNLYGDALLSSKSLMI